MDELYLNSFFFLISLLVVIYDIITLPLYLIFQKPWEKWNQRKKVWACQINKADPFSPYKSSATTRNIFPNVTTISQLFQWALNTYGNIKFLGTREVYGVEEKLQKDGKIFKKFILGDYKWISIKEVDKSITNLARGLRKFGLNPKDKLVFISETRAEWFLATHACFRTNIVVSTLYTNLGDDGLVHGIKETESNHLLVSAEVLPKIKKLIPKLTNLTHIIYLEGTKPPDLTGFPENIKILSFSQLESSGENLDIELVSPSEQDVAILMYTSGSTGAPKGVLISHKCVMTTVRGAMSYTDYVFKETKVYPAYLPSAHIMELIVELFCLSQGTPIAFSSAMTLMDNSTGIRPGCKGDLTLLKPLTLLGVPLMLDRIRKRVNEVVNSKGTAFRKFFQLAMGYKKFWMKIGFETPILNRFVFRSIRKVIGGNVKYMITGSAPLSPDTEEFVRACLGVDVIHAYGLTETTGCGTLTRRGMDKVSSVGPPIPPAMIRLIDWDEGNYHPTDKPYPRGEVVIGSDGVTVGYYKNEQLTKQCYKDEDGIRWFYTGDIAEIHPDGCLRIIDRKKDLVKLQFGEYISLGKVEGELLTCPLIDNVCVFGNGLVSHVVALIVPNSKELKTIAERFNKDNLSFAEQCCDSQINKEAIKIVQKYAAECRLLRIEIPQKIKLCSEEWSPETGHVTAAFKVRRKAIENYYKDDLNAMMGL